MASFCARRAALSISPSPSLRGSCRSFPSAAANVATSSPSAARISRHKLLSVSRLPAILGCAQSLMPLHSVTSSSLLTSMLSLKTRNWGWLSEGLASTL
ncbi:protein NUCLEAR FUSION DEFECTIVE 6, mitochondrial [Aristolochia californica]|uniref:protein NUCLEAR FUSION DEFECTIVE 6, mitochondrial n=1 Tax=Aristolochia californica TaxID=171875 RepID=UPI0035D8896A